MIRYVLAALISFQIFICQASALPRLAVQGNAFVEAATGKTIALRGVTVTNQWWGRWVFPQSDTLAAHGEPPLIRYTRTVDWFLDSIDYYNLQALGGNVVRYEFSNELFEPSNPSRESNFADVRQVIRKLASQGKYTLLCMSGSPGMDVADQNHEDTVPGSRRMKTPFEHDSLEKDWDSLWVWLAVKLAGDSAVAGFELLNEPRLPATADISPERCAAKYVRLCGSIRAVDPSRLIMIPEFNGREANLGETYYSAKLGMNVVDAGEQGIIWERVWPLLPDTLKNIAMVFHWYDPWSFVNDGDGDFSASGETAAIQDKLSWPKAHNRPVVVTEYGANYGLNIAGKLNRRVAWYQTVHDIFSQNNVSTCAFTFKGEIGPYIAPNTNYQLWVQYVAAADQIKAVNGKPAFKSVQDSAAAAQNGFDSLLVKYLWQNGAVVNRSCLGSGPVLDELRRYFGAPATDTGVLVFESFSMPYRQGRAQNDIAAAKGWQLYGDKGVSKTGGFWYSFTDANGSTAKNASGHALDSIGLPDAVESGALHVILKTSTATVKYPWAAAGAHLMGNGEDAFDLSELTSLVVRIKGTASAGTEALGGGAGAVRVTLRTDDIQNAGDWGFYGYDITPNAAYQTLTITPSQLKPEKNSGADTSGWTWKHGAGAVRELVFMVKSGSDADIWIDSIAFTGLDSNVFGFKPTPYKPPANAHLGSGDMGKRSAAVMLRKDFFRISYRIAGSERVRIGMFDLRGRRLALIERLRGEGEYEERIPAHGKGIAVLRMRIGGNEQIRMVPAVH